MARLGSLSLSDRSQRSALSQAADAKGVPVSYPTHPDRPGFQTDRGGEFFGIRFQIALQDLNIKFRPIRPRSPHLNGKKGKVERSQLTDKMEFWPTVEPTDPAIEQKLLEWQRFYNAVLQCGSTTRTARTRVWVGDHRRPGSTTCERLPLPGKPCVSGTTPRPNRSAKGTRPST
jgi:transposase InsO family protein